MNKTFLSQIRRCLFFAVLVLSPSLIIAIIPFPLAIPEQKHEEPLVLTVEEAVLLTLEHNQELRMNRLTPAIRHEAEELQNGAFDPILSGQIAYKTERAYSTLNSEGNPKKRESIPGKISLEKPFSSGTTLGVESSVKDSHSDLPSSTRVGLSVTQALLKGASLRANLAKIDQARMDSRISDYELRGIIESMVAQVEKTYWDYALAQRQIGIVEDSLALSEQQLRETQQRIQLGKLAEIEVAAAQVEVAARREALISARRKESILKLQLLRLLNPPSIRLWQRQIILKDSPNLPDAPLEEVEAHIELALKMRPDLNQARLQFQQKVLEVVRTQNGMLPKLDLFLTLGKTGYSESFGKTPENLIDGNHQDFTAGIRIEYPLGNRSALAEQEEASLRREQSQQSINNLIQLIQVDIRSAYLEVEYAYEQIAATVTTRKLREATIQSEIEKFRLGKSTNFLVSQAQRDLLESQIGEVQTIVFYRKAIIDLYRLEGSLLQHRGLEAPGQESVE